MRLRQEKIIQELLEKKRPMTLESLANKMDCSARTIRNDLKPIEKWIQVNSQNQAKLKRQPGVGTYIDGNKQVQDKLLQLIKEYQNKSQLETSHRRDNLLFSLLMSPKNKTIDELSDKFYESKETIRADLEAIKQSIQKSQLELKIEPRTGILIKGPERIKRTILAQLIKKMKRERKENTYLYEFFERTAIEKVNRILKKNALNTINQAENHPLSSIAIHILFMIERIKNKSTIKLKDEEWTVIKDSLALEKSQKLSEELSQEFALSFPKDEEGYLALHIASLEIDGKSPKKDFMKRIEEPVEEIVHLLIENVSKIMSINLSQDNILRKNLQSHLESAYLRVMSHFYIANPLLEDIKTTYPHLFLVIQMILEDYAERSGVVFPEEEMAYLTVHFKAAFERNKEERSYKAIITCNHGIGVSSFLEAKISHAIPEIEIIDLLSYNELKEYDIDSELDFVITTTDLPGIDFEHIKVSPLMETKDIEKLKSFIKESHPKERKNSFNFEDYTNSFLIQAQANFETKEACLSFMCEQLEQKGYISPHYKNSVFEREDSSSTQIAPLVAIPHGNPSHVLKTGIFIATLKKAVDWGNGEVQLVLLLALHKEDLGLAETKNIFSSLYRLTEDKNRLERLLEQKNQLAILKVLSENYSKDSII